MSSNNHVPAVNPLPPVVAALFLIILGIEAGFTLGSRGIIGGPDAIGWRLAAIEDFAFSPAIVNWMWETGRWPARHLIRFLSYIFVHASFTHALFVGVFLLAMGKMVAEVFGGVQMLAIFLISGVGGALGYTLLTGSPIPLIGGFPAVYGLIGAFTFMLWRRLSLVGANQARAFTLIAFLMGVQLLFGLLFGGSPDWVADLSGFATGFALSFLVSPGGWARLRRGVQRD